MFKIDTVSKVDATNSPRTWKNRNSNQSNFFNTDNIMRKPCDVADDILATVSVSAVMTMTHTKPTEPIRRRRRRRKSMPLLSNINGAVENNNNNCGHHHELMPFEISQRYFHDFPDATTLPSESLLWDRYRRGVAEDKNHKEHYVPSTQPFQLPPRPSCASPSLSSPSSSSSSRRKQQKSTSKSQNRKTESPTSEQSRPSLKPSYSDRIMALDLSSKSILSSNRNQKVINKRRP